MSRTTDTPAECTVMGESATPSTISSLCRGLMTDPFYPPPGVPSITTNLSGFGGFMEDLLEDSQDYGCAMQLSAFVERLLTWPWGCARAASTSSTAA